jgi:poly-D-alanine transfer protein DltD
MLLDNQRLVANKSDNQLNPLADTNLDVTTINTSWNGFTHTIDKIIDERSKSAGRKRIYDDIRSTTATKEQQIKQLEKILNASSGKLASNNIFVLNEHVWAKILDNKTKKKKKASEIQNRKQKYSFKRLRSSTSIILL